MYIHRILEKDIQEGALYFPVVAILGPRQSGKTTLAKKLFAQHNYVSLEETDIRELALHDPRTFLQLYRNDYGMIIDEFQHAPDLLSYIQTIVDSEQLQGYFILTGSQNFLMNRSISQSLAGRVSLHTLLPLSIPELEEAQLLPGQIEHLLYKGLYPATYTKEIPHKRLYAQYVRTYLQRDVHLLTNVGDLSTFQTFLILCAERVGQLINYSELGKECRISDNTVRRWLSILEASYIIFLLRPYEKTQGKRLIKSPKLFFYDSGLVCYLLRLKEKDLIVSPKRGNIFESFVISEIIKHFYNHGEEPTVYFWQDQQKHEVDCVISYGIHLIALEIKASRTPNAKFFSGLSYWKSVLKLDEKSPVQPETYVIYGASQENKTAFKDLVSWQSLSTIMQFLD